MMTDLSKDLKALGSGTTYKYDSPDKALLEAFPSPLLNLNGYQSAVKITCPEFTSLCPKTGQPDFATIKIEYQPNKKCVESKSLKLYLGSFRNHGEFHESCVQRIASDLIELLDPEWMNVTGEFTPRGGIPFWPTVTYKRKQSLEEAWNKFSGQQAPITYEGCADEGAK